MNIIDEIQAKLPEGQTLSDRTKGRIQELPWLESDRYDRSISIEDGIITVTFSANDKVYTIYTFPISPELR